MTANFPLVMIEWEAGGVRTISAGWLIEDGADKVLASSVMGLDGPGQITGRLQIPTAKVLSLKRLEPVENVRRSSRSR